MKNIKMIEVDSSTIRSIGYDNDTKVLYVCFVYGNSTYAYFNVEVDIVKRLLDSNSKGKFLSKNFKGVYRYERIR